MVLLLVRWRPACSPRIRPKRYSSPICAPESRPKRSPARSPKFPSPSGRPKRCVTRKALSYRGSRSVVGSVTTVKSGCARLRSRSGSSSCAEAGMAASANARVSRMTCLMRSVSPGAELNPAPDNGDLALRQVRTAYRHASADNVGTTFKLVDQVAVFRISGRHARQPLLARRHADQRVVRARRGQIQSDGTERAAVRVVTGGAGRAAAGVRGLEDVA